MDYYTKWIEVERLSTITERKTIEFVFSSNNYGDATVFKPNKRSCSSTVVLNSDVKLLYNRLGHPIL